MGGRQETLLQDRRMGTRYIGGDLFSFSEEFCLFRDPALYRCIQCGWGVLCSSAETRPFNRSDVGDFESDL